MAFPDEDDRVIVRGIWVDEAGRGSGRSVTATPSATILTDLAVFTDISPRKRTVMPDADDGEWQLDLLATNHPDFTAFAWTITLDGQKPFAVEVDFDAPVVDVGGGVMRKALWLRELATTTTPTPVGPTYYTAAQTDAAIEAGGGGGGAVASVNGQTGTVVLDAGDIGGLAAVATTGAYADLTGTPSIPAAFSDLSGQVSDAQIPSAIARDTEVTAAVASKADTSALTAHTANTSNPHSVTKAQVGLGNADNTSDLAKPVSTATTTAISAAINNLINSAPGTLDTLGEIAAQLATDESAVTALTAVVNAKLAKASNLFDLANPATARTNLGLGGAAVLNVGTGAGTVSAGDDSRLSDARTPTTHTHPESDVTNLVSDLGAKAADSAVVHNTGTETVAGAKTFSTAVTSPAFAASGLSGLSQGRFVGVSSSGAPTSGTFAVGDYVVTANGNVFVCTVAGTPGTWVTPSDLRNALAVGEETIARDDTASNALPTTSQSLRLTYFKARRSETTTQIRVNSGGTAAGATPTLVQFGLYSIDAAGAGTLVASTPNDTSLFAATGTPYTKSWSTPYAKVAGQQYALGILVVTSATAPTLPGLASANGLLFEYAIAPRLAGTLTLQATLPSSFADASLGVSINRYYAAILP